METGYDIWYCNLCNPTQASARDTTKARLSQLPLARNAAGQYTHKDTATFVLSTNRVLCESFNALPTNGMTSMLHSSTNALNVSTPPPSN